MTVREAETPVSKPASSQFSRRKSAAPRKTRSRRPLRHLPPRCIGQKYQQYGLRNPLMTMRPGSPRESPMRRNADSAADATSGTADLASVSLFSNCGAGDVGFAAAGFSFRVMAELVGDRLDVALRNHPNAVGVAGDLRDTWQSVVDHWRLMFGAASPSLVAACPPCQGMSTVRTDRGAEDDPDAGSRDARNLLVLPISHITKALLPTFLVVENVTAFLRRMVRDPERGEGVSAAGLLIRLLRPHYDVYPFLTDLADFGVPQRRKRAFLTFVRRASPVAGILRRTRRSPYPVPTHSSDYGGNHILLGTALAEFALPPLDSAEPALARDPDRPLHFVPVWPAQQRRMVAAIPPGSGSSAWENNNCPQCATVVTNAQAVRCPVCEELLLRPIVSAEPQPRLVRGFRRASYRRMEPTRPAATITTASGRVGSSRTIHPFENRVLSPLECALLQTIPADFNWKGGPSKERRVGAPRDDWRSSATPFHEAAWRSSDESAHRTGRRRRMSPNPPHRQTLRNCAPAARRSLGVRPANVSLTARESQDRRRERDIRQDFVILPAVPDVVPVRDATTSNQTHPKRFAPTPSQVDVCCLPRLAGAKRAAQSPLEPSERSTWTSSLMHTELWRCNA